MGALSVVICAILSHFFLKESLTTFGAIGCALCIVSIASPLLPDFPPAPADSDVLASIQLGSIVIALNGPTEETVGQIADFQKLFLAPGFLVRLALSFTRRHSHFFCLYLIGMGWCCHPDVSRHHHLRCTEIR